MLWDWVKEGENLYNLHKERAENFFGINQATGAKKITLAAPSHSQFNRSVMLILSAPGERNIEYVFPVNPEEFDYTRPERIRVTQTLGEPFIDEFGTGVPTLIVRGTTGWRTASGRGNVDGYESYRLLHRNIYDKYFLLRQNLNNIGQDPDNVSLKVYNDVDNLAFKIVPMQFKLLRSKTRPLLYQYDLNFTVIEDLSHLSARAIRDDLTNMDDWIEAFRKRHPTLSAMIDKGQEIINNLGSQYNRLKQALLPVFQSASNFIGGVGAVVGLMSRGAEHVASSIYGITYKITDGLGIVRSLQTNNIPFPAIIAINNLFSAITELTCYMSNGKKDSWLPDFSGIEGISDCGLTRGVTSGPIASNQNINGVEWISRVAEIAKSTDASKVVSVVQGEYVLGSSTQTAPVMLRQGIGNYLDSMVSTFNSAATFEDCLAGMPLMASVFDSVSFDPDMVTNETSEYLTNITQIKTVTVAEGDSLQSIAYRELGDALRWKEIVAVNDIVIENPQEVYHPRRKFTSSNSLTAGESVLDYGKSLPFTISVDEKIQIKDSLGNKQTLKIASIATDKITFHDTFSRPFIAPIDITCYVNRADMGVYDYATSLLENCSVGQKVFSVEKTKDIYSGYKLYIQNASRGQLLTVKGVDYVNSTVEVYESPLGFSLGDKVLIFDALSNLHHLEPGFQLKIPITTGSVSRSQTDREIYGADLALDKRGFMVVKDGDIDAVEGIDNFKQAIHHRIICPTQSIIVHPEYGCDVDSVKGEKNTNKNMTFVKSTIIEALNNEPRVDNIKNIEVGSFGDVIAVAVAVESIERETLTDLNIIVG